MSNCGKIMFLTFVIVFSSLTVSQVRKEPAKIKVMTMGIFHFSFPNLDVVKIEDKSKIDIYKEKYQKEINAITEAVREFRPTRIVVERQPSYQRKSDSLYAAYKEGRHSLARDETEQLGFRIASKMNIDRVECVDTWGKMYDDLKYLFNDNSERAKAFDKYYFNNPDSVYEDRKSNLDFSGGRGIIDNLIELNDRNQIKRSLGSYLIGHFKYEEKEGDYTGADFETGRWFNRNLRIFRNIQRGNNAHDERVLVIFGSGHMNLLNFFFESSPEYQLVSPEPYLRKAKKLLR